MERCLKAFGCSNTFGAELKSPKKDAWPFILGKLLNLPVENYGLCGASNEEIIKTAIENSSQDVKSFIIILKTEHSRLYWPTTPLFYNDLNINNSIFNRNDKMVEQINVAFNMKLSLDDISDYSKFLKIIDNHESRDQLIYYYNKFKPNNKYVSIQPFCSKKILSIKQWLLYHYNEELIKTNQNFLFNTCEELLTFRDHTVYIFDFKKLTKNINCKKGVGGHYLEEGNKVIGERIYEKIQMG